MIGFGGYFFLTIRHLYLTSDLKFNVGIFIIPYLLFFPFGILFPLVARFRCEDLCYCLIHSSLLSEFFIFFVVVKWDLSIFRGVLHFFYPLLPSEKQDFCIFHQFFCIVLKIEPSFPLVLKFALNFFYFANTIKNIPFIFVPKFRNLYTFSEKWPSFNFCLELIVFIFVLSFNLWLLFNWEVSYFSRKTVNLMPLLLCTSQWRPPKLAPHWLLLAQIEPLSFSSISFWSSVTAVFFWVPRLPLARLRTFLNWCYGSVLLVCDDCFYGYLCWFFPCPWGWS